jgi:tRNA pseudouridine38-40 synthase
MALSRNIRLKLAYDGTAYCGWQVQSNGPSIQAALERAIERLTGEKSAVYSAGRTDSGVHALGQVANFHTSFVMPARNFRPALQTKLPHDIIILEACETAPEFHATFAARWKHYRYVIDNSPLSLPFLKRYAWQLRRELDDRAMDAAARLLLGRHDFRSFETDWPNKVTSVRTIMHIAVTRRPQWELWTPPAKSVDRVPDIGVPSAGRTELPERNTVLPRPIGMPDVTSAKNAPLICIDIVADGFLYNMVRAITGTLINVGRGKWSAAEVSAILQAQKRSVAGSTAPACGLFLVDVGYDGQPPPTTPES